MLQENTYSNPGIRLVELDASTPAPANFYFSREDDPASAIEDMLWAVHTVPHNVALWNPPEELVPSNFRDEFASLFETRHSLLNNIRILQNRLSQVAHLTGRYSAMRRKFNKLASATGGSDGDIIHEWGRISIDLIEQMTNPAKGRFLSVEFQSNGGSLALTRPSYGFHFDRRSASGFHEIRNSDKDKKIRFCDSLRLLWIQAGPGTVYAANDSFERKKSKILSHRFLSTEIDGYQPSPWHLALLTSTGWSHQEILHSTPAHGKGETPQSRLLWNIDVRHRKMPSFSDFAEWEARHRSRSPQ